MLTTATAVPGRCADAGAAAVLVVEVPEVWRIGVCGCWAAAQPAQTTKPPSTVSPANEAKVFFTRPTPCLGLRPFRDAACHRERTPMAERRLYLRQPETSMRRNRQRDEVGDQFPQPVSPCHFVILSPCHLVSVHGSLLHCPP